MTLVTLGFLGTPSNVVLLGFGGGGPTPPIPPVGPPGSGGGGGGGRGGFQKWISAGKVPNIEAFPLWKYLRKRMAEGISLEQALNEAIQEKPIAEPGETFHFPDLVDVVRRGMEQHRNKEEEEFLFLLTHLL